MHPLLERIAARCGETVMLAVFDGREVVYLDKFDSLRALRIYSRIGHNAPLHCGAMGKAILAGLSTDDAERLLGPDPLERFTANTITNRQALSAHLATIRKQGYAVSSEELDVGVLGVGIPLLDWAGHPVGAISVTGPRLRLDDTRPNVLAPVLRDAAAEWRRATQREFAPSC